MKLFFLKLFFKLFGLEAIAREVKTLTNPIEYQRQAMSFLLAAGKVHRELPPAFKEFILELASGTTDKISQRNTQAYDYLSTLSTVTAPNSAMQALLVPYLKKGWAPQQIINQARSLTTTKLSLKTPQLGYVKIVADGFQQVLPDLPSHVAKSIATIIYFQDMELKKTLADFHSKSKDTAHV